MSSSSDYIIPRSLRFRSTSSAYMTRTPAVTGNRRTWTFSTWVKRGSIGSLQSLCSNYYAGMYPNYGYNLSAIFFTASNTLRFITTNGSGSAYHYFDSNMVFRDTTAWYHIVVSLDTTQSTYAAGMKVYVNGTQITSSHTAWWVQNTDTWLTYAQPQFFGYGLDSSGGTPYYQYFDGYLAETNFIDGQQLPATSFGGYNSTTGVWRPKKYTGTYGTNGFYLNFNNLTSTTTLGYDTSGNSNNWTPTNISLTNNTTYDSMIDTPTPYDDGGYTRGNYVVMNYLSKAPTAYMTNGNLTLQNTTGVTYPAAGSTIYVSSGKWYWEVIYTGAGLSEVTVGISAFNMFYSNYFSGGGGNAAFWNSAQGIGKNTTYLDASATFTYGNIVGVAFDADAGTVTFYKNGVAQATTVTGLAAVPYTPAFSINYYANGILDANFGQRPFSYTPPTGYKTLNTYNLPTPTIPNGAAHMGVTTYSGTSATQNINNTFNNASFQPDLVWIKNRSSAYSHYVNDSVRGVYKTLFPDLVDSEYNGTSTSDGVSAFNSNGFTLLNGTNAANYNASANTYVAFQWKGGGAAVANTSGTITSQVSANRSAGFSIATYTGNGTAGATIGHGLNAIPSMIIAKCRNVGLSGGAWTVWHKSLSNTNTLYLDNATNSSTYLNRFDFTGFTTDVWKTGSNGGAASELNTLNNTHVAYCWSEVAGYSSFGSYVGNDSIDGPFIYCGFRPAFVMVKATDATFNWGIWDDKRGSNYNPVSGRLYPDVANVEDTYAYCDFVSNGFKIKLPYRDNPGNYSGVTYMYAAFAENPFKYALAR